MEKVWVWCCYGVSAIIFSVSYAVSVLFLAIVGSTLGAFTGVLLGMKSQGSLFSRMVVGAVAGSVLSINTFKTSVSIWLSDDGSFHDVLQWTDSTTELDAGELVQRFLYNLALSRIEQTLAHADNMISEITVDRTKVSKHSFDRIGRIRITEDHLMDSSGNRNSCSICLQDFECKDVAKRLPSCRHLFHLRCIDKWISKQRSCPLCRSPIVRVN
ncbi:NEP1-interacting protein 1-like [Syzygium oleosum]|uniref:NEP1-interacting protein 1-like n=1 Tax=Syzygium oleosum TaxID=219896 RepID=UPI0011D2700B|nr:NEP1-interacting protein 1-like [Syzygium oleosum]